ncbi:MFS transporter [Leucobacter sp. M11]|uniref:MFS transporter n=1 Tax=Leucobacter sp. M11 TaxID=2993565 RepID=UPI002D80B43A|nr:MFS transporter [Leucobacter sp. M11]MEB4613453.1 MFS transporter [Leucobacter sp. M11]
MTLCAPSRSPGSPRFPVLIACLCAAVGFLTLLTEVLPAGILPALAADLGVPEALAGQSTGVFALGCIVSAIALSAATARVPRRTLLLGVLLLSAAANLGTAFAPSLPLHLGCRFLAGCAAGVVWAALPGYTRGVSTPERFGAMLSIALGGGTLSLTLGVPVGTLLSAGGRVAGPGGGGDHGAHDPGRVRGRPGPATRRGLARRARGVIG